MLLLCSNSLMVPYQRVKSRRLARACKALHNLSCPYLSILLRGFTSFWILASLLLPEQGRHTPASRRLYWLFLLKHSFPKTFTWHFTQVCPSWYSILWLPYFKMWLFLTTLPPPPTSPSLFLSIALTTAKNIIYLLYSCILPNSPQLEYRFYEDKDFCLLCSLINSKHPE